MKNSSFVELCEFVNERSFKTISLDIDGTIYPMKSMVWRWWKKFFLSPGNALRFLSIKNQWERRRKGEKVSLSPEEVNFFESFLVSMMDESLVSFEIRDWIKELEGFGMKVFFLSDHGAEEKLRKLGIEGEGINCFSETGELKPHVKISAILREKYGINAATHLHVGDRWTDEEQAKLIGCEFRLFRL